jgi:hypothetical protein
MSPPNTSKHIRRYIRACEHARMKQAMHTTQHAHTHASKSPPLGFAPQGRNGMLWLAGWRSAGAVAEPHMLKRAISMHAPQCLCTMNQRVKRSARRLINLNNHLAAKAVNAQPNFQRKHPQHHATKCYKVTTLPQTTGPKH